jgi:protein TonB
MQPHRLSYGTAGTAPRPRVEPAAAPRQPALARVPTGPVAPLRHGPRATGRSRHRPLVIAAMVAAHGLVVVALVSASRLHSTDVEARPVFLAVVDAPAPAAPSKPLPPPPLLKAPPPPTLELPLIAPEPSPSPSPLVAQVVPPPPPAAPVQVAEAPAAPAPSLPRTLPAAGVQFLVPPAPVYSRISAKMHEHGKAMVRVYIDEAGMPRNVQIVASSGFARLDDSALVAVRNSRFKPYVENGVAVAGWASIPIEFELT